MELDEIIKKYGFVSLFLILIPLTNAATTEFGYNYLDNGKTVMTGGNYTIDVNNTYYFQGYTPTTLRAWMQSFFNGVYCVLTGCQMTGDIRFKNAGINSTDYVQFNTSYSNGATEGRLKWNPDDGTLDVGMPGGNVNLQLGQEQLLLATNNESETITNCKVVYISGATGTTPKIKMSNATNYRRTQATVGIATENILSNQRGYVTTLGLVRDCNTSLWSAGTSLYLSTEGVGNLTSTIPTSPNATLFIGIVIRSHATEGIIWANPILVPILEDSSDVYIPESAKVNGSLMIWNNSTRRFELSQSITVPDSIFVNGNLHVEGNFSARRPYLNAYDNTTQNFLNVSKPQVMNISTTVDGYLIHIINKTNITFEQTGDYLIMVSPEFFVTSGTNKIATFWIRKNGVDVPWTNSRYTITQADYDAPMIPFQVDIENPTTDNVQIIWWSDTTSMQLISFDGLTSPTRPSIPSVILNVKKVSEITD